MLQVMDNGVDYSHEYGQEQNDREISAPWFFCIHKACF